MGQLGTLEKAGGRLVKRNCEYIAGFLIIQDEWIECRDFLKRQTWERTQNLFDLNAFSFQVCKAQNLNVAGNT